MSNKEEAKNWGSLIIVINPATLGSPEEFESKAMEMCMRVKNAKKLPFSQGSEGGGGDEIFLPGERGDALEAEQLSTGMVRVSEQVYKDLVAMSQE